MCSSPIRELLSYFFFQLPHALGFKRISMLKGEQTYNGSCKTELSQSIMMEGERVLRAGRGPHVSPRLLCQSFMNVSLFSKIVNTSVTSQPCSVSSRMLVQLSSGLAFGSREGSELMGHPFLLRLMLPSDFRIASSVLGLCTALAIVRSFAVAVLVQCR